MDFTALSLPVAAAEEEECGYVLRLNASERCAFVRQCADCLSGAGKVADYTQLYFCTFEGEWGGRVRGKMSCTVQCG